MKLFNYFIYLDHPDGFSTKQKTNIVRGIFSSHFSFAFLFFLVLHALQDLLLHTNVISNISFGNLGSNEVSQGYAN